MLRSLRDLTRKMTERVISKAGASGTLSTGINCKTKLRTVVSNGIATDSGYEDAVKTLHGLQSNAEVIAKARQNIEKKRANAIPNMNKYILRSGLTEEDVDKLSVIHVSGTKGKGSTCAFCERILACHGHKTGLFSSPHLIQVRERIRINGRPISTQMFSKYFWKVYNNLQETQDEPGLSAEDGGGMPAYFAFLTVMSLHVFIGEGVDVAIMEVGIGGQYDSTNFFRKPVVCGVTSLGLDHTALLGNTIEEIAWNKAGIFKPGRPAVTVPQERAAMDVILSRAVEIQSPLYVAQPLSNEVIQRYTVKLGVAGAKQVENASLAIQLYRMWKKLHVKGPIVDMLPATSASTVEEIPSLEVSEADEATVQGLSSCVWPGRAQTLRRGEITYYLDGAHTKESIETCAKWFKPAADEEVKAHGGKVARILVFNATGDRDVGPFLSCLKVCNFDAAVFCTNLLSTVESFNRPDQLNRTVTPRWMMEKVESSKASWDALHGREGHEKRLDSPVVPSGGSQLDDSGSSQHQILPVANGFSDNVDHNFNRTCPSGQQQNSVNGDAVHDDQKVVKRLKTTHGSTANPVSSDYARQSAGQARRMYSLSSSSSSSSSSEHPVSTSKENSASLNTGGHNSDTNTSVAQNFSTAGVDSDSKVACPIVGSNGTITHPVVDSDGRISSPTVDSNNIFALPVTDKSNNLASPGGTGSAETSSQSPSLTFPCILQALLWATQGRDPVVEVGDPDFVLPPIPDTLREKEHVQILITGSLHLVGGVLGVVDPEMND